MTHWSFSAPTLLWVVALGLGAFAAWLSYQNWDRSGRNWRIGILETIRFILVTALLFTLLRPEWVQTIRKTTKPEVVVLIDRSRSMETRDVIITNDQVVSRAEWLNTYVTEKNWDPIARTAQVYQEEFSGLTTNTPALLKDPGTDLSTPLEQMLQRHNNLKAVLVLTDGDWNDGKPPLGIATRYEQEGIPIYSVAVGRENPLPDLILESANPPSYGLVGEQITLPFVVRSRLAREVKTQIILGEGTREITKKTITIPPLGEINDSILYSPQNAGSVTLRLKLPVEKEEALSENNEQTLGLNIRLDSLKVLVVDSYPRWEYRFLRNALARDPGVKLSCVLLHPELGPGGGRDYLPRFPSGKEALSAFDVIFLGDVGIGPGELSLQDAELIRGVVEQQSSGLILIPGRRGRHATLLQSALKDILPVVLDPARPDGIPLQNEGELSLSTVGRRHLLTRFDADENRNEEIWKQLPGFYWSAAVEKSRPGSEVLAVHSSLRNASGRMPLLVTRNAGTGKVLFLGTDSAWRWRRGVEDKFHYRFWSQVVRWMSHQRHLSEQEGIRLSYTPESPQPGDTLFMQATVLNAAGSPIESPFIDGIITFPSGQTEQVQFDAEPGGWGVFKLSHAIKEIGPYKITIQSEQHQRKLETIITATSPSREKIGQPINRQILSEIAALTGGKNVSIEGLTEIIQQISVLPEPQPMEKRIRLWSHPVWGGVLLGLLTIYWLGRKLVGLI